MYRNGKYVDPRRITVPQATSVPEKDREVFGRQVNEIVQMLDGEPREQIARDGSRADVLR
jgi:hypothetical protein